MAKCSCTCTGHVCNCANEDCPNCPCGPNKGRLLAAARIERCQIHSINYPYGQTCPECNKNSK